LKPNSKLGKETYLKGWEESEIGTSLYKLKAEIKKLESGFRSDMLGSIKN